MSTHTYRSVSVPVGGGELHVGVWDPTDPATADVLLVHGVTSSHRVWPFVVDELPGVRAIGPDLRGRGRSNEVQGPAGMRAHADDLAAVLDELGIDQTVIVGHSMGAFVALVFAHLYPERVSRLLLVDGGLPLDAPEGLDADALVAAILGPTAARLSKRFGSVDEYLAFWQQHPAFVADGIDELGEYFAYDLVEDGEGAYRPATTYQTTVDDTVDLNTGTALIDALEARRHPTHFISVPRGLQDETPGLYAPDHAERMLRAAPDITHTYLDGLNHYSVVMSRGGAAAVAQVVRDELAHSGASGEGVTR